MSDPPAKFSIVQGDRTPLLLLLLILFMLLRTVVSSDVCEDGTFCPSPNLCCEEKCCLLYETGKEFSPIYRLSLWNAWYFWFIVIFIVISCFGGCGYWRRRHMHFVSTSFHRRRCGSLTPIHEDPQGGDSGNESSRPQRRFIPMSNTFQNPPPYNEVTSKPDMYPLVQGGHDLKHESLAFVYATTPFFHSYLPYNSGAIGLYLSSPAESNSSSLFQSTTASSYMYPPPYSDGIYAHPSVSTPGSMLSACTPTEHSLTTHFLSSTSPPMATTPTSQQMFSSSEVTTPADSLTSPTAYGFYRQGEPLQQQQQLPVDPFARQVAGHLFANLVADIQQMTSQMMVTSPAGTSGGGRGGAGEEGGGGARGRGETTPGQRSVSSPLTSPLTPPYGVNTRSRAVQMDTVSNDGMTSSVVSPGDSATADQWSAEATGGSRSAADAGALSLPSLSSVLTGSSTTWPSGPSPTLTSGQRSEGVNEGTNTSPVDPMTGDEDGESRLFPSRNGAQQ